MHLNVSVTVSVNINSCDLSLMQICCWIKHQISPWCRWVRSPRSVLFGLHVWERGCEWKEVWKLMFWFTWWSDQSGRLCVPWWRQGSAHGRLWSLLEWSSLKSSVEPSRGSKTEATGLSLGWSSGCCSGRATTNSSQYAFMFYVRSFVGFCGL